MDDTAAPEQECGDPLRSAFTAEIEGLVERIRVLTAEIEAGKREDGQRGDVGARR
jgi:hypothetical protein